MFGPGFGSGEGAQEHSLTWLRHAPVWKAGIEALDEPWRGDAPPRAMVVVMAEGDVLHDEVVAAADVQTPADVAAAVKWAVDSIAAQAGCYPRTLLVHDPAVAEHLAPRMARHGTGIRVPASLHEVQNAVRKLARLIDEPDVAWDLCPLYGFDEQLDPAFAAVLFPAAARFWRARPWERVPDETALRFRWRTRKSVVVLSHPKGHGHVVTLFTSARDYYDPQGWSPRHIVLGIRFEPVSALPRALRRQIASQRWEVAGPQAYPLLMGDGPAMDDGPAFADIQHLVGVLERLSK
ncbi:hypothetical protein [Longimicrobium sp.]|uniref:hypothetical protein n=1 Tax=Longimicrobium sp. TaxID=2029185 RepID=UPI003B3B5014